MRMRLGMRWRGPRLATGIRQRAGKEGVWQRIDRPMKMVDGRVVLLRQILAPEADFVDPLWPCDSKRSLACTCVSDV